VYPGAIYTIGPVTLRDCVFDGNQSHTGGAIKLWDGHTYVIERCVFTNNRATYWGGAISNHYSRLLMRDCVFWNNESGQDGGAVGMMGGQGRFSGCTFIGNSGDPSGAIGCEYMTVQEIEIERCIIAFSQAGVGVDSEFALTEVSHCYVYSNAGGDSLPDASHDNEFDDPRLCDITTGDVALCADSPCLVSSPHNPWGVAIGALGQGCVACGSAVAPVSWGHLKAMYRAQD